MIGCENDYMIEQFTPHRSDPAFGDTVLPWGAIRSSSMTMPSLSSSPWIRGAPQRFSAAMRIIKSRISLVMRGLPTRRLADLHRHTHRKSRRCYATTVSGSTINKQEAHLDHNRRIRIQKARSRGRSRGSDFWR